MQPHRACVVAKQAQSRAVNPDRAQVPPRCKHKMTKALQLTSVGWLLLSLGHTVCTCAMCIHTCAHGKFIDPVQPRCCAEMLTKKILGIDVGQGLAGKCQIPDPAPSRRHLRQSRLVPGQRILHHERYILLHASRVSRSFCARGC